MVASSLLPPGEAAAEALGVFLAWAARRSFLALMASGLDACNCQRSRG